MSKTKVTVNFKLKELLNEPTLVRANEDVGQTVADQIKRSLNAGVSPVEGVGRFEKYSESYRAAIKAGRHPGKTVSPVNLKSSGKLHDDIDYQLTKKGVEVGVIGSDRSKEIAQYLSDGTMNMPARPIMPQPRQSFNKRIEVEIKRIYSEWLSDTIKRSNSR